MNFIERIRKIFNPKKEEIKEITTTISLYDLSDIELPKLNELTKEQQNLYLKYKSEIDINNLECIIKYNEKISKEGEQLSNLLIKILYELNEVIRKDNKLEYELQEIDINNSIKNKKIIVIRELLQKLKQDCDIRTLAIQDVVKEYENKEHKFIEIFSRATRIKRNMELKSLKEAETRSKITIKTLIQQLGAVNNAILSNDNYQNHLNVYNSLNNNINNKIRKGIYVSKLEFYVNITKTLKYKFTRLSEISDLLKQELTSDVEQQIINNFAITEIELDKYILDNKDKMVEKCEGRIIILEGIIINHENKNKLLEEAEKLQTIVEVYKKYIKEHYIENLYNIKFNILTFDINNQIETYSKFSLYLSKNDYYKEKQHYINIIFKKISFIKQGFVNPFAKRLYEDGKLKEVIKLLNSYFKTPTGKYDYENILFNREKLALLLAFDSEDRSINFFKENKYSIHGVEVDDSIHLPYKNFEWEDYLPLETIYTLYEADGINKPKFYDIYKLYYQEVLGHAPAFKEDYYYLPDGITSISTLTGFLYEDSFLNKIRSEAEDKFVVFPSSLKRVNGNFFGETQSKGIILNDGLEYIGENVFRKQHLEKIIFSKSVRDIAQTAFDFSFLKEIEFKDFKDSKLLYNLLYEPADSYKNIINKLFEIDYSSDTEKYKEYSKNRKLVPKLKKIVLSDKDEKYELTYSEIYYKLNLVSGSYWNYADKVRICLSKLIEQKTGINIKEYQYEIYRKGK